MSDTRRLALELHEIRQLALGHATNPQFGNSSVDGEGLSFRDGDGHEIGRIGGGENGMEVEYTYGPKPLMPSTPIVTADANLLLVQWDGLWAGGNEDGDAAADPDLASQAGLDRVEVHVSMEPTFVPDPIVSFAGVLPVTQEGGAHTVGPLAEAGDYYVVLMARGKDGQYSAPSQRVHVVTTVGLMENELFDLALRADEARESADGKNTVHYGEEPEAPEGGFSEGDLWFDTTEDPETGLRKNTPHLWDPSANDGEGGWVSAADSRVDAIRDAQDALREDVEQIVTDGAGATTYWLPTEPDETAEPTPKEGDIWFDTSDGNKMYRHDGAGWVSASDSRFDTIQDAYDDLSAEVDTVRTSVDGKNRITQSIDAPPTEYDGSVGDRWERMSSMGSGGRMISNWSWNGDVWVSSLLSDEVIANLDAAKITTGFLDAARLEAGSVQASSIAVGDFTNYATIDPVRDINVTRPFTWSTVTEGDYTVPAPGSQNYLMFKDRTDTVPFKGGESLRAEFRAIAANPSQVRVRIWAYPAASDGSSGGSRGAQSETLTLGTTDQAYSIEIPIPESFNDTVLRSWILGLIPGSGTDAHDIGIREVRVTRMTGRTLIQDGAITTDKIAVGAITAESGVVESLDAGDISVGEIAAARIGAKTITADKMLVGPRPDNMIVDVAAVTGETDPHQAVDGSTLLMMPGITGVDGYNPGSHLAARSSASPGSGADRAVVAFGTTSGGTRAAVEPSTAYALSALVRVGNSRPHGTPNVHWAYTEYDHAGVSLGTTHLWDSQTVAGWDWSQVVGEFTTQQATSSVEILLSCNQPSTGVRIVKPAFRPKVGTTLIEDGAITTDKIAVGAITAESGIIGSLDAGVITTGELRGELIRAQSIAGESLAVDAIDGKTITGATVRTSSAGARVEMDSSGLFVKNSVGINTVSMTNGTLTMTGGTITGGTIRTHTSGARVQLDTGGLKAWNPSNEETFSISANTGTVSMRGNLYSRPEPADSRVVIDNSLVMNRITREDGAIEEKNNAGLLIGTEDYNTVLYTRIPDGKPFTPTPPGTWLIGPDSRSSLRFNGGDGDMGLSLKTRKSELGRQATLTGAESGGFVHWESRTENRLNNEYFTQSVEQSSDTFAQTFVQSRRRVASDGSATVYTYLPTGGKGDVGLTAGNEVTLQAGGDVVARTGGSRVEMQSNRIALKSGGDISLTMNRLSANLNTGSGTDLILTSSNYIGKKSSSRRYKIAEEPIGHTLPGIEDALLGMEVKTWFDRRSSERLAEAETEKASGIVPSDDLKDVDPLRRIPGVVAEDLDAAGLGMFVVYNNDGSPESVMYDRLGVALVPAVKSLRDRVNELERMMGEMANA